MLQLGQTATARLMFGLSHRAHIMLILNQVANLHPDTVEVIAIIYTSLKVI